MNFEQARHNMIEQQIRPAEVLDQKVLDVIAATPREDFVPVNYRNLAFVDMMIPLGHGQTMLTPIMEGRMLQALALRSTDNVLEIGTGSGYTAAMLAKLGRRVTTVEIHSALAQQAQQNLNRHGGRDVTIEIGDGSRDWHSDAPYDAIVIGGSVPLMPNSYKSRLKIGGRLFAIVGDSPVMECVLITRLGEHEWTQEALFETDVPALVNAPQPQRFTF
ncbi:MAG: protein-L-isoaspartate O-methyltransferase [Gammaproteobacteria bacterium]|nr:protein-L-isoaspartate O-methyltransferase [Gammaproteobacteria bacterium]